MSQLGLGIIQEAEREAVMQGATVGCHGYSIVWLPSPSGWPHCRAGSAGTEPRAPGTASVTPVPPGGLAGGAQEGTGGAQEGRLRFGGAGEDEEQLRGMWEGSLTLGCCSALEHFPREGGVAPGTQFAGS